MEAHKHPRVVVARHADGGIGDHLSCLVGAWWFAKRTGRLLIVDWRGSRFNARGCEHNCFVDFFGNPSELAGVPVVCDDRVVSWQFEGPFFPAKWNAANLHDVAHVKHTIEEITTVNRLLASPKDRSERTVAFNQWIEFPRQATDVRKLIAELRFTDAIRTTATAFWDRTVGVHDGIAIHIRHGNGENIGYRAAYWLDPWRLIKQLWRNVTTDIHRPGRHGRFADNMPESLISTDCTNGTELQFLTRVVNTTRLLQHEIPGAKPLLFCDAPGVTTVMQALAPEIIIPSRHYPEVNGGPLHALSPNDQQRDPERLARVSFEMAVDMELIRRCKALVYMHSGFTILSTYSLSEDCLVCLQPERLNRVLMRIFERLQ